MTVERVLVIVILVVLLLVLLERLQLPRVTLQCAKCEVVLTSGPVDVRRRVFVLCLRCLREQLDLAGRF